MATITPKEKDGKVIAYKFRACVGRDENGRQVCRATTWKVPENLSMVRLEKAVQRAAADWEKQARAEYEKDLCDPERIKAREVDRTKTDFARFVLEEWFPICIDNGERKPKTVSFYHDTTKKHCGLLPRTNRPKNFRSRDSEIFDLSADRKELCPAERPPPLPHP